MHLLVLFWLVLAFCAVAALLISLYFRSVAGSLAVPVRDSEIRLEFLGISVNRLIHLNLVISGTLAGIGGALAALSIEHVDPNMAYWTTSGGFVFVTILAGAGSVAAAFVGSFVFELLKSIAYDILPGTWQIFLGAVLLLHNSIPAGGHRLAVRQAPAPTQTRSDEYNAMSTTHERDAMSAILVVRDVEKTFGSVVAARDINVAVPPLQTVGIIGANGAGKTTFVNMITGHLRPSKGAI